MVVKITIAAVAATVISGFAARLKLPIAIVCSVISSDAITNTRIIADGKRLAEGIL